MISALINTEDFRVIEANHSISDRQEKYRQYFDSVIFDVFEQAMLGVQGITNLKK